MYGCDGLWVRALLLLFVAMWVGPLGWIRWHVDTSHVAGVFGVCDGGVGWGDCMAVACRWQQGHVVDSCHMMHLWTCGPAWYSWDAPSIAHLTRKWTCICWWLI